MSAATAFASSNERSSPHAGISLASGSGSDEAQYTLAAGTSSSRGPQDERCRKKIRPRDPLASGHRSTVFHCSCAAGTTLCAGHSRSAFHSRTACANTLSGDYGAVDAQSRVVVGNTLDAGHYSFGARTANARVSLFALTGKRRAIWVPIAKGRTRGEISRHYAGQHAPQETRCLTGLRACSIFTTKSNREETTWM